MGIQRGFPNLRTVREALRLLIPRVLKKSLPPIPDIGWSGWSEYDPQEPLLSVQGIARKIASVYQLDIGTIIVSFEADTDFAGRIELHGGREFFIELNSKLKSNPRNIAATLGHEVAHIFLNRHGLRLKPDSANEILTDIAAALYGFGVLMADTFVISETRTPAPGGVQVTESRRKIGYLTADELGYVMTRMGLGWALDQLTSHAARVAFREGRDRAQSELSAPPLTTAGPIDRFVYVCRRRCYTWLHNEQILTLHRHYAFQNGGVVFRCPICTQAIRLPPGKRVNARCPNCESDVESRT